MSKVKLLQEAAKHIGSWLGKADAATLRAASARIGANVATRGVGTVVNSAKENPVTAALLLFEMGALGSEMLDQLASSDERVAKSLTFSTLRSPTRLKKMTACSTWASSVTNSTTSPQV